MITTMSHNTFLLFLEKIAFILSVTVITVFVVLMMDTIQSTMAFATAPASAAIAIVVSWILSMAKSIFRKKHNAAGKDPPSGWRP